ncbi:isochorismatase family protein [Mycobacteroides immunogenum]|uniref:Isochorismatase n=1 Tax=Mycobacteroides immunogenum TaxID=83262 RepID=A0A7V8RYW3_9MYCO|nr:isochorismatase family protein [Mycobacteroides immunogenum]AMT72991.1 isochorismatase [Mycobacteroides immunogenum]ANO06149.1 isochorismatase [Mycobacteroides immunogenum]KIU41867.1 isochorismatase [Mycobacteroides immunogenum]KPG11683.1 isochorismatase [Mycobacteroides immunogenum]KPG11829.1 isochorismatase [Mycobacteroides immunogenum]
MRRRTFLRSSSLAVPAAALGLTSMPAEAHADVRPTGSITYPFSAIHVPATSAPWTLEPDRAVLLVHDMQHYFVKAYAPQSDPIATVLKNIKSLLDTAHAHQVPVYYSAQPGGMTTAQRGLFGQLYGPGMPDDDAERAIVDPLGPTAADTVLTKWKYSEFFRSDLLDILRNANRDQLIIVGVYAFSGITATSTDAIQNDIQAFIVSDAVADYTATGHNQALTWCAERTARILTTRSALSALANS